MATLQETWDRHAQDVINGNIAGLMGDFMPAAMTKAMSLGANPIRATSFETNDLGNNEVEISYIGDTSKRTIWSKWEQSGEKWQIADLAERS
jgi:hypothetical protein